MWPCALFAILLACTSLGTALEFDLSSEVAPSAGRGSVAAAMHTVRILERISYGREAPEAQMLNAYLVQRDTPTAAIVQILSGGWNSSPPQGANLGPFQPYLDAGISVIVAAHRPVGKEIHWPAPCDDVARAVQFVRDRAGEWGIDPNRIAVKGRSSGGHLALMVGFGPDRANSASADPVEHRSSKPNCIVAGAAPTDLVLQMSALLQDSYRQAYLWERMLDLVGATAGDISRDELLARLKPLSPIEYVGRNSPPVFLTHQGPVDAFWPGDARLRWDVHTPITGLILEKKLKELEVPYELVISPENTRGDTTLLRRELAFLARHLRLDGGHSLPEATAEDTRATEGHRRSTGQQSNSSTSVGEGSPYGLGAKFEPPAGRVIHAMGQWEEYNAKLLPLLPAESRSALIQKLVEELRKPHYLHADNKTLLKDYTRFAAADPSPAARDATRPTQAPSLRTQGQATAAQPPVGGPNRTPDDKRAELAKFDDPASHLPASGPGGTDWDPHYRSFIQSQQSALSKGFPSHAEAAQQIKMDAARDPANLQRHKGWILFIKHHSQAYRPPEATAALRKLYEDLIEMEFGGIATTADLPFAGDPRLTIHRDVIYGKTHPLVQRLDVYLVKSARPVPVLIEIHGGGWRRGSKSQFVYPGSLIEAILNAGISLVSVDYRLTPEHTFPAQMEDVVRAVQFVRSQACDWNVDPNRIAAMGGSAGAHLAAWVGLHDDLAKPESPDPIDRFSSRLACFVSLSGPMDLTRVDPRTLAQGGLRGESFAEAFVAAVGSTAEQFMTDAGIRLRLRAASPLFLVSSDDPAALVVAAGPAETAVVPPTVPATINDPHSAWHGALLADALRRVDVDVVARLGPDVGKDPQADAVAIVEFLKKHLE